MYGKGNASPPWRVCDKKSCVSRDEELKAREGVVLVLHYL